LQWRPLRPWQTSCRHGFFLLLPLLLFLLSLLLLLFLLDVLLVLASVAQLADGLGRQQPQIPIQKQMTAS
jgi:hypothetical protein